MTASNTETTNFFILAILLCRSKYGRTIRTVLLKRVHQEISSQHLLPATKTAEKMAVDDKQAAEIAGSPIAPAPSLDYAPLPIKPPSAAWQSAKYADPRLCVPASRRVCLLGL
jgi:hypothetical protein